MGGDNRCNNDYESSPGGGDGSSNHHTQLGYYVIQYLGRGEITGAIMITNLLLGRETVHQIITHNCTFLYIQFYIYMVTKYHGIFWGGGAIIITNLLLWGRRFIISSHIIAIMIKNLLLVVETVHQIITHNWTIMQYNIWGGR